MTVSAGTIRGFGGGGGGGAGVAAACCAGVAAEPPEAGFEPLGVAAELEASGVAEVAGCSADLLQPNEIMAARASSGKARDKLRCNFMQFLQCEGGAFWEMYCNRTRFEIEVNPVSASAAKVFCECCLNGFLPTKNRRG